MIPTLPEPNPEPIRTVYNALPAEVQRKVSLHDLKRICDALLPITRHARAEGEGWRLLSPGEPISEGDQLLRDDFAWETYSKDAGNRLFIGQKWNPSFHVPVRTTRALLAALNPEAR